VHKQFSLRNPVEYCKQNNKLFLCLLFFLNQSGYIKEKSFFISFHFSFKKDAFCLKKCYHKEYLSTNGIFFSVKIRGNKKRKLLIKKCL